MSWLEESLTETLSLTHPNPPHFACVIVLLAMCHFTTLENQAPSTLID